MKKQSVATRAATARPWEIQRGYLDAGDHRCWLVITRSKEKLSLRNDGRVIAICHGPDAAANARLIVLAVQAYEEGEL